MDTITTLDAEAFKDSVFLTISLKGLSFKKQVRNPDALIAYYQQREQEIQAKRSAGEDVSKYTSAVSGNGNGLTTRAAKGSQATTTTKTLLFSPALDALREHLTAVKSAITAPPQYGGLANPSGLMDGLFELSKALVSRANEIIEQGRAKLETEWTDDQGATHPGYLTAFLADYPAAIERARTAPVLEGGLGPLFNPSDYPTPEKVAAGFDIARRWIALGIPEGLPPELRAQAAEELKADLKNAAQEIIDAMREGFAELLEHAKEVLTTTPGEKPKIIKDSLIGNVLQFCEVFSLRNTQGDARLAALVAEAKERLTGVDPEKLRKFANVRQATAGVFTELAARMDEMITTRASRKFELED